MENYGELIPEIGYFVQRHADGLWRMDHRVITFHDISYFIAGRAEYEIDGQKLAIEAGDVLYTAPGQSRNAWTGEGFTVYTMDFSLLHLSPDARLPLPTRLHVGKDAALTNLFVALQRAWMGDGAVDQLRTRAYGELILSFLLEAANAEENQHHTDVRVKKAAAYLMAHLTENVTVNEMAAMVGLTPVYFSSLFKRHTGETVKQYQIRMRLNHAEKMLRSGQCNVSEAAQGSGFCDVYYFSRLFTQYKGIQPSQVKKQKGNG